MSPVVLLILAVIVAVPAWCIWAWFFPHTFHRRCRGRRGQGFGSTKYGWSRCRAKRCNNGEVVRLTARVISNLTGRPIRGDEAS